MATGQDLVGMPTPAEAARALADIEARRGQVLAEYWRLMPLQLAVTSASALLDYAAKDLIISRRGRWTATALLQLAAGGVLALNQPRVQPWWQHAGDPVEGGRDFMMLFGIFGWMVVGERVLVWTLRRSRLRRPNTTTGLVLAITRPAAALLCYQRMIGRAR